MRYLINDDDLDEVAEFLYKSEDSKADYLLDLLLVQMYGSLGRGREVMNKLYCKEEKRYAIMVKT